MKQQKPKRKNSPDPPDQQHISLISKVFNKVKAIFILLFLLTFLISFITYNQDIIKENFRGELIWGIPTKILILIGIPLITAIGIYVMFYIQMLNIKKIKEYANVILAVLIILNLCSLIVSCYIMVETLNEDDHKTSSTAVPTNNPIPGSPEVPSETPLPTATDILIPTNTPTPTPIPPQRGSATLKQNFTIDNDTIYCGTGISWDTWQASPRYPGTAQEVKIIVNHSAQRASRMIDLWGELTTGVYVAWASNPNGLFNKYPSGAQFATGETCLFVATAGNKGNLESLTAYPTIRLNCDYSSFASC